MRFPDLFKKTEYEQKPQPPTFEEIIARLPVKVYNGQQFRLMFLNSDGLWSVSYYSKFSNTKDVRFPAIARETIKESAIEMLKFMKNNYPKYLK